MRLRFLLPTLAFVALCAGGAYAQPASGQQGMAARGQMPFMQTMDRRFMRMNAIMNQAESAHGARRMALMRDHMQLMLEQMQTMQGMMGTGMMNGRGMMGGGGMGVGPSANRAQILRRMQDRMDIMQQMMAQMLKQQSLMMPQARP